jgi:hypothetical protein
MLMYSYPAAIMPLETIASACARTMALLTLQAKWFQLFHPIGGVWTRFDWANAAGGKAAKASKAMKISEIFEIAIFCIFVSRWLFSGEGLEQRAANN